MRLKSQSMLLLLACVSASAQTPPSPTAVKTYGSGTISQGTAAQTQLAAIVLPPSPATITLTWDYPGGQPQSNVAFEVWHSLNFSMTKAGLQNMTLLAVVDASPYTKQVDQQVEFFAVRAVDTTTNTKTDWAKHP